MTDIWKIWSELLRAFAWHLRARGRGQKPLFGIDFELWPNISATEHDINNR